jgi:hypothetical protein
MPAVYRYVPAVAPPNLPDITWTPVSGNRGADVETAYGDYGRASADVGSPFKRLLTRSSGVARYLRLQRPPAYRAGMLVAGLFVPTPTDGCDFYPLLERVSDDGQARELASIWVGIAEVHLRGGVYCVPDLGDDPSILVTKNDVRLVVPWRELVANHRDRLKTEKPTVRAERRRQSSAQLKAAHF